jgi:antitoxin component YwqK of YwqJK toxin-antitoxin module
VADVHGLNFYFNDMFIAPLDILEMKNVGSVSFNCILRNRIKPSALMLFAITPKVYIKGMKVNKRQARIKSSKLDIYLFKYRIKIRRSDVNINLFKYRIVNANKIRRKYNRCTNKNGETNFRIRYINGKTAIKGSFLDGKMNGRWAFYNLKGGLCETRQYSNGAPSGRWEIIQNQGEYDELRFCLIFEDYTKGNVSIFYTGGSNYPEYIYENWKLKMKVRQ